MAPYSGSNLLAPLSNELAVPIDQINFIFCELLALVLAAAFRLYLHPRLVSPTVRHAVAGTVGLVLGFFCFGRQMLHMIAQAAICYAIMRFWPRKNQHVAAFIFAMVYLSIMHIYRMYQDYGGYSLDITGPLMISTQKVTSLAFSVHDGLYKEKKDLNPDQNRQAVRRLPNPLVYLSYIFYFQGILVGPLCFYTDYIDFIEGSNFQVKQVGPTVVEANGEMEIDKTEENKAGEEVEDSEPSPLGEVAKKMGCTLACAGVAILIAPTYSIEMNTELPFIQNHTFIYRVLFLMVACMLARAKYYFAWKFGEAVSNASGLGFNGYTSDGKPIWDLVTNVNIRKLETATSLKVLVDSWNVQTTIWLRRICYDRLKYQKTVWTFVLSALWHGFYPGYYFTFLGGTFFIEAARKVRRRVRPYFLTAWWKKMIYDITTWFFAQLSLAYLILPFACLEFWPVFHFYHKSMHWFLHLGVVVILLVLPSKMREITPQ